MAGPYLSNKRWNALEASRKKVPRYLFRAFGNGSGGGGEELNSDKGITPRAFVNRNGHHNGHRNIQDIPNLDLMLVRHLNGQEVETEFSSWAASLALVLTYADEFKNGYVCVLDRTLLPTVTIYHVPDLKEAMNSTRWNFGPYPEEYLAHGIINGPGFKALSTQKLHDLGVWKEIPILSHYDRSIIWWKENGVNWNGHPVVPIRVQDARKMRGFAEHFGSHFTVVMTAALLSITRRQRDLRNVFLYSDMQALREGLDGLEVLRSANKLAHGVYVDGYEVVAQLMDMLDRLVLLEQGRTW